MFRERCPELNVAPAVRNRPKAVPGMVRHLMIIDPEGGAQDVRRFSTRQDAASKNPGHISVGRFASAPKSFLWLLSLRQRK
jgi:hypothetical protein